jgi:hypothetical protein
MILSFDEALLLFQKWQHESMLLRIKFSTASLVFDATGIVREYSRSSVDLGGDSWRFTALLEGASMSFSDPREIPVASVRQSESDKYELGVALQLSSGERLLLMELKDPHSAATGDEI